MLGEAVPGVVEGSQAWAAQVGPYKWPSKWVAGVIATPIRETNLGGGNSNMLFIETPRSLGK